MKEIALGPHLIQVHGWVLDKWASGTLRGISDCWSRVRNIKKKKRTVFRTSHTFMAGDESHSLYKNCKVAPITAYNSAWWLGTRNGCCQDGQRRAPWFDGGTYVVTLNNMEHKMEPLQLVLFRMGSSDVHKHFRTLPLYLGCFSASENVQMFPHISPSPSEEISSVDYLLHLLFAWPFWLRTPYTVNLV